MANHDDKPWFMQGKHIWWMAGAIALLGLPGVWLAVRTDYVDLSRVRGIQLSVRVLYVMVSWAMCLGGIGTLVVQSFCVFEQSMFDKAIPDSGGGGVQPSVSEPGSDEPLDDVERASRHLGSAPPFDPARLHEEWEVVRAQIPDDGMPVVSSPVSLGPCLDALVDELVRLGRSPGFLGNVGPSPFDEWERFHPRARAIGVLLDDVGGFRLMQVVSAVHRFHSLGHSRELEVAWQYIGSWRS